ncbi:tRNA1(Val) (adenine(37)-N6)-methyltransferase [uncultured Dialister sp.]|uniref:tRNA1(Val) (adenine(37)-N6)-methyltransferase n=1 Tax=uncultured Dialister sp. TaxID=278064 RepID=UPI0025E21B62|nr:methyltransferase [uncultured Dialister sp.]
MIDWKLKKGERLDNLVRDDMKIIQRTDQFCFSVDSVLLAHYPVIKPKDRIIDLGTGTGVISLLASALGGQDITAIEVNPVMADLARRNVMGNDKEKIIHVLEADYREARKYFPSGYFSLIFVNPPYREVGSGRMSENHGIASASYELNATLDEVFKTAQYLLKYGGRMAMVHRADRLADLISLGRKYGMEPKRMRLIYARKGHNAVRVLLEWKYGGHAELSVEPPLLLHNKDGSYTDEVMAIYGKEST